MFAAADDVDAAGHAEDVFPYVDLQHGHCRRAYPIDGDGGLRLRDDGDC